MKRGKRGNHKEAHRQQAQGEEIANAITREFLVRSGGDDRRVAGRPHTKPGRG
jgi:hypothetical protein